LALGLGIAPVSSAPVKMHSVFDWPVRAWRQA
jgi:hypothetical protein